MALTNAFYEAVKTGNVRRVRIMMKDSLLLDPTFKEFKEMQKAASSMQGLYDTHDGKKFENNVEKWNDDYMNDQMVHIVNNFSKERIAHLKDIVQYLHPAEEKMKNNKTAEVKHGISPESSEVKVAAGVFAGALLGAAAASAVGVTAVGGAVGGAVLGGAAAAILNGGK